MWSVIIPLSFYVSGSLSRRNALIDDCNWISDNGFFSINLSDPPAYCNVYRDVNDTGYLETLFAWYYDCDTATQEVTKYIFPNTDKCLNGSGLVANTWTTETGANPGRFNCDSSNTGDCLMKSVFYYGDENCDPGDTPVENLVKYGVNGACEDNRIISCNDCQVQDASGNAVGFAYEGYPDEACSGEPTGESFFILSEQCVMGGPFVVEVCNGNVDPIPLEWDTFADCSACATEIEDCLCSADCLSISKYLYDTIGPCSFSAQSGHNVLQQHLCNNTDCEAVGVNALYTCLVDNECVKILDPADSSNSCECDPTACVADTVCAGAIGVLDFDNSPNIFEDIHEYCTGQDCTELFNLLQCYSGCDDGSDDDDDNQCMEENIGAGVLYGCLLDFPCYKAINGSLGNLFNDDSICDTEVFCSPRYFQAKKDAFCEVETCPDNFNTLFTQLITCFGTECPFVKCTPEISACEDDADCAEDLFFVSHIEDNYNGAHDDNLVDIIVDRYCVDKGGCHELLHTAYECVKLGECLKFSDDQCWEIECKDEVDACIADGTCIDALIEGIRNETECRDEMQYGNDTYFCPHCNDLDPANFTSVCGVEECGSEGCYGKPGTRMEDYDPCRDACDKCGDAVLSIGKRECGDGQCGSTYQDLLRCVLPACPDDNAEEDECFRMCFAETVDCLFDTQCESVWQWVQNYFDEFGEVWWKYPSTEQITGCSEAEIGALFAAGDEEATMAGALQCRYWEIKTYCDTEDGVVCSTEFWNMVNCLMTGCWNIGETIRPTAAPTTPAPTTAEPTTAAPTTPAPTTAEPTTTTVVEEETGTTGDDFHGGSGAVNYNVFVVTFVFTIFSMIFY